MKGASINHDCVVEEDVVLCNDVFLGGHVVVMKNTSIGPLSAIHQRQVIGSYCQLGMSTVVPKLFKIEPGYIYAGNPARKLSRNIIKTRDVSKRMIELETSRYEGIISDKTVERTPTKKHSSVRVLQTEQRSRVVQLLNKLYSRARVPFEGWSKKVQRL